MSKENETFFYAISNGKVEDFEFLEVTVWLISLYWNRVDEIRDANFSKDWSISNNYEQKRGTNSDIFPAR